MKKSFWILLISVLLLPFKVLAQGGFSLSTSSISMYPGESKTVTIYSDNSVGKLNISSSDGGVAEISVSSLFVKTPGESQSFTIKAGSVGTSHVSVVASSDYATMDEEVLTGVTKTITVNVIEKTTAPSTTKKVSNNKNNTTNKSSNNKLKELSAEGYTLEKVDDNNYKLVVSNNVTNININAVAEDNKASITGTGLNKLNVGDNNIVVVVTSESGTQNKINIIVSRKDGYYLEELESIANDNSLTDVNIIINKGDKLSKEDLEKIKSSGKNYIFNYYDESKILRYSFIIDGSKLGNTGELLFDISNNSTYLKDVEKLSNYASILGLSISSDGTNLNEIKIKYYVADKYNDNDKVNLYTYDENSKKIKKLKSDLVVSSGYIEFSLDNNIDYFISMANIGIKDTNNVNYFMIISIAEFVIIIGGVAYYFLKIKKANK
jgi:hypothetical protein